MKYCSIYNFNNVNCLIFWLILNIILDVGNIYLIQDTCLEVTCCITKNDGTLPDKSVGTVNNLLHSMFESVRLTINDISTSFRVLRAPESWSKYFF